MAARLLACVWCLLLLGGALAPELGADAARLGSYAACGAVLLLLRAPGRGRAPPCATLLAGAAGFVALPAWLVWIWGLGVLLGLPPAAAPPAAATDACVWLANVALAPLFEELLYRERLLPALRRTLGTPLALVASSALFAVPHVEPWSVLAAFAVGLALGTVFLAAGHVAPCIAYHAGLNAAALACGVPPTRASLGPLASALAGAVLLALACTWTRRHAARPVGLAAAAGGRSRAAGARWWRPMRAWRLHRPRACRSSPSAS